MIQESSGRSGGSSRFADSAEASHTAHVALDHISPRAPTPYPEPLSQFSDLLHPSPPLRRRKALSALREDVLNSPTTQSIMPNSEWAQEALRSQIEEFAVRRSDNNNTYLTPPKLGKLPKATNSQDAFSGDEIIQKKSTTDPAALAKPVHKKKSLRKFFKRKGSKEPTTPPSSSSGNTAGGKIISAPTLISASPNAKALLHAAPSLINDSPSVNVVNFSRPLTIRSTSEVSSGSPVRRGRSKTVLHGSNPFSGASTSPGEFTPRSGIIPVGPNNSTVSQSAGLRLPNADKTQIRDHSKNSPVHGEEAADGHGAVSETLATEKKADANDSDSFDPSDYSGDENSVHQAVAVPIIFSGRAKLVDIHPPRKTNTAAGGNGLIVGTTVTPCATPLTDREAEALGAQDADRYYRNALNSQTSSTNITGDGPSIDAAYQNLIAKPANEIAAKEMARIKAAREARNMGGGLVERMNALRAKNDAVTGAENTGEAFASPHATAGENPLPKMRAIKKTSKKGKEKEQGENEADVVVKVQAEVERGLREENQIHEMIKSRMAARAAASGLVHGAGIPRIDYGQPNRSTALGASSPTDEERTSARTLTSHLSADVSGNVQEDNDNKTARGRFEGC